MPALSLSCRVCATEHPLGANGTCTQCFGPLDPTYDWDALRAHVSRASIEAGPPSIWRYADLLPVEAPAEARLAPGLTPLVPAARLAQGLGIGELWLKLDTANPTHSFKDRVVAVAACKAQELGFDTLSCSSTGNLAGAVAARAAAEGLDAVVFVPRDLEPEKLAAAAVYGPPIYAVDGTYDHCSRLSVELSFELPWGFVNVNCGRTTPRARRRSPTRSRSSSGGRLRTPLRSRSRRARSTTRSARASRSCRPSGSSTVARRRSSAVRRPGASRWRRRSARAAASSPSGRTASPAHWRSAIPPTATSPWRRRARRAEPSTRSPRTNRPEHGRPRCDDRRVRRDRDGRDARSPQGGVAEGSSGRRRASSCSSRATG